MAASPWWSGRRSLEKEAVCLLFYYRGLPVKAYPQERSCVMQDAF